MKKILVISDSHGNAKNVKRILDLCPDADMIVHLGDGASDLSSLFPDNYEKPFALIEGNGEYYGFVGADRRYRPKRTETVEFEGKKIFMTHGHKYNVRYSTALLAKKGKEMGADICLYGHTHRKDLDEVMGITVINPGTASESYAVLEIENGEINVEFKNFC